MTEIEKELNEERVKNAALNDKLIRLNDTVHNLLNDYCGKCGKYREEHLGACDTCYWYKVKYCDY